MAIAAITLASADPALACRGQQLWSIGDDLGKLRPAEFVVRARLIESYKGEQAFPAIMGNPYGMIYFVKVEEVVGGPGATAGQAKEIGGANIFIHLSASVCESYFPLNFSPGSVKSLVLTKGEAGLFELVGGEGRKYQAP